MKARISLSLVVLLVLLSALPGQAQGPEAQAPLGTGFTYQGQLRQSGSPYSGTCDFQFSLWDAASSGAQIGGTQTRGDVAVARGLFNVLLDFGAGAFKGDARWLGIKVRCPAGSGDYTTLAPRQALTAAPYALALPGLWTEPNATSPNVIGGYSGNSVTAGAYGATIGGGGESGLSNRVTDSFGVVAGGRRNQAGDDAGTTLDRWFATVGGGWQTTASGVGSTISGGIAHTASGYLGTVGGGYGHTANGSYSTVGGGDSNTASNQYATVPGGYQASATLYGQMAYASGQFAAPGDAQSSQYVMRATTTSAGVWEDLWLDGSSRRISIPSGRTVTFDILIVGRSDTGESAAYHIYALIENVGGATTRIASTLTVLGEDDPDWTAGAFADDAIDALLLGVRGNGETIRWVASVRTSEVSW